MTLSPAQKSYENKGIFWDQAMTDTFQVRGGFITLDAFLKATGAASTGGEAKHIVASGAVRVDGVVETRRGRKLRGGETVEHRGKAWRLLPSA